MAIVVDSTSAQTSVSNASAAVGSVITLVPRLTTPEGESATYSNVCARVTGVNGLQPTFVTTQTGARNSWSAATDTGFFSYDGLTWFAAGVSFGGGNVTCQPASAFTEDTVWFARYRKEGVAQIAAWITTLQASYGAYLSNVAGGSNFVAATYSAQTAEDARAVAATPLYAFWAKFGGAGKKQICLVGGVHAAEDWGTTILRKMAEYIFGSSQVEARSLRAAFDFLIVPLVNPPGKEGGHSRTQFEDAPVGGPYNDLNRHFEEDPAPFETVELPRAMLDAELTDVSAVIDFHGFFGGFSNKILTYEDIGSSLQGAWQTYLNARVTMDVTSAGVTNNTILDWAIDEKSAPLSAVLECNQSTVSCSDANAVLIGESVAKSLYDLLAAGHFGARPGIARGGRA